jgi:hypothetical protein
MRGKKIAGIVLLVVGILILVLSLPRLWAVSNWRYHCRSNCDDRGSGFDVQEIAFL